VKQLGEQCAGKSQALFDVGGAGASLSFTLVMRKLAPDFWTISEFRKQNVDKIKGVFKGFVSFLQEIDLVEGKLASLDGSKIKACNARKRTFTKENLDSRLKRIEERIERYMKELETNDADDEAEEREPARRRSEGFVQSTGHAPRCQLEGHGSHSESGLSTDSLPQSRFPPPLRASCRPEPCGA
jgi:hypothetical protein